MFNSCSTSATALKICPKTQINYWNWINLVTRSCDIISWGYDVITNCLVSLNSRSLPKPRNFWFQLKVCGAWFVYFLEAVIRGFISTKFQTCIISHSDFKERFSLAIQCPQTLVDSLGYWNCKIQHDKFCNLANQLPLYMIKANVMVNSDNYWQ